MVSRNCIVIMVYTVRGEGVVVSFRLVPYHAVVPVSYTHLYMQEGAFVYDKLDISWIDPEKPMIAFTFDDGPVGSSDSDYSMRILNVLKEYGMHATFNYVTSKISNDSMKKEILTSMENGNEIANHTSQWSSLSDLNVFPDGEAIAAEVEKARAALEEMCIRDRYRPGH